MTVKDITQINPYDYRQTSRRQVVYGTHGMAASSQQMATLAGMEIMKKGGNAVDAAIAMAIALTVTEPVSNGLGGDAFAILWTKDGLRGLNASGPAGSLADAAALKAAGYEAMPDYGMKPVTVPGIPSAWITLSRAYGKLPFKVLFEPAIRLAEEGFPVTPVIAGMWQQAFDLYTRLREEAVLKSKSRKDGHHPGEGTSNDERSQINNEGYEGSEIAPESFDAWFKIYAPEGRAPRAGEIFKNPALAGNLRELADTKCESFYRGSLAGKIAAFSAANGGFITAEDLASYQPEWVTPVSVRYRDYDIWEIPPNGHGIIALMTLNMLSQEQMADQEDIGDCHRAIEALKLAYADGKRYVADIRRMSVTVDQLLDENYAAARRSLIGDRALEPFAGQPAGGGTVYLCTADDEGNMVSYIQSNYWGFGSGMVVPGTSIALHNRGREFSLDPSADNYLLPGKKPYHTIIPGFITRDGEPVGPFGVMGGYMQPQGHVQVLRNMIDFGMNPQQALDRPRWQWVGGKKVLVEYDFPLAWYQRLQEMGHEIYYSDDVGSFGRGQIILRRQDGLLVGGTEPRADGAVLGW